MKTSELTGAALDWAVAKCESEVLGEDLFGLKPIIAAPIFVQNYKPSTDWAQGGPIIEREGMRIECLRQADPYRTAIWTAGSYSTDTEHIQQGPTPLIAAMRCFCSAKLGDVVDIPEELCQQRSS